ncbi:polysaccharide lyase [Adhaeribacter radiodurans]|uniref:Heparin lyase I family protein n=1 Tax=Adhaeribacter radiodurans TaxID=2745197 RepID=A0A7L7LA94_9BACT|nr:polysaccharide lyase [Adhaeribacter radiodurans]QMU29329.1 heparin lyase I family protein [Adhaeribacter radiodurans]
MKIKLLLSISLLSLFTVACETEEIVELEAAVKSEVELTSSSNVTSVDSYRNNLMVEQRFETTYISPFNKQVYTSHGFALSGSAARTGSKSARIELRKADNKVRSEILLPAETSSNRWYGLSMYLPSSYWQTSTEVDTWDIIAQWHAMEDDGEAARFPPIALVVSKGRLNVVMYWATRSNNTNSTISGKKVFDLGPVIKDKWVDFVFHINFSHESDGIFDVWLNGTKTLDYSGPNSYNDNEYPYFKTGIYKRKWGSITKRALFIDDIRTAGGGATYADVAPSGSGSNNPPVEDPDTTPDTDPETDPGSSTDQKVESFTLINADTDREIKTIANGETLDLANLPTKNINIRANTSFPVGSVYFNLSGAKTYTKTEGGAPYSLFGDTNSDYAAWQPATGQYTLKATPYTEAGGKGEAGTALTVNFTVVSGSGSSNPPVEDGGSTPAIDPVTDPVSSSGQKVISFTLINGDTDREIKTIANGETLNLANLPTKNINIRANTNTTVGSVKLNLSGKWTMSKTESAPYTLFGDEKKSDGSINYGGIVLPSGDYTLKATPYTESSGQGTAGTPLTINFTITQ